MSPYKLLKSLEMGCILRDTKNDFRHFSLIPPYTALETLPRSLERQAVQHSSCTPPLSPLPRIPLGPPLCCTINPKLSLIAL